MSDKPTIGVVGVGYVGLTTGACLAHIGHTVVCGDVDAEKINRLRNGEIPIVEEGLTEIVSEGISTGRLEFVVGATEVAERSNIVFLCVPTPQDDDGSADLSFIEAASAEIGPVLRKGAIVVNKSTVPVGTTIVVDEVIQRADIKVVSNLSFSERELRLMTFSTLIEWWLVPTIAAQRRKSPNFTHRLKPRSSSPMQHRQKRSNTQQMVFLR